MPRKSIAGTGNRHFLIEEEERQMLTAKYIDNDGNEILFEILRASSKPNPQGGKQPIEVVTIEPNGHTEHFSSGRIFVMNESGATVSNWLIINEEETNKRIGKADHPVLALNLFLTKILFSRR